MSQVLSNIRVLITRPIHQAKPLEDALSAHGAIPLILPTIQVQATDGATRQSALKVVEKLQISHFDGLLLTSTNAVASLIDALNELRLSLTHLRKYPLFCVGPATERFSKAQGLTNTYVAETFSADGVLQQLNKLYGGSLHGKTFLFPRAKNGRETLAIGLEASGATVEIAPLYETIPIKSGPKLPSNIDWITFTSPSAVEGFVRVYGSKMECNLACIGPITHEALKQHNLQAQVIAPQATIPMLVEAIVKFCEKTDESSL